MLPWQHFVKANLFGWVDKKTVLRRFREGIVFVSSGNGKSTLITGNTVFGIDGPMMDLYVLGGKILENTGAISPVVSDRMLVFTMSDVMDSLSERIISKKFCRFFF